MEYTIENREDLRIVIARATGEWDAQTEKRLARELMEIVATSASRKVLVDLQELNFELTIIQIFERARELLEQRKQFSKTSAQVALVFPEDNEKLEGKLKFFETVARNRGLPYRAFATIEDAMAWLTE